MKPGNKGGGNPDASDRLNHLKSAIHNEHLEGDLCPACFNQIKALFSGQFHMNHVNTIQHNLNELEAVRDSSILKTLPTNDPLKTYQCRHCDSGFVGRLRLLANSQESGVLSYHQITDDATDIRTISVINDRLPSLIDRIWNDSFSFQMSPREMMDENEDPITGVLQNSIRRFFEAFAKELYKNSDTLVKAYPKVHAGTREAGRGGFIPSGADLAMWIGTLTKEDVQRLDAYDQGTLPLEAVPNKVGNGIILQAKKTKGAIIPKQLRDFRKYGRIRCGGMQWHGFPGKLFLEYSIDRPHIIVYPSEFSKTLCKRVKRRISFASAKRKGKGVTAVPVQQLVQSFLTGLSGTPILMLRDIMGSREQRLVFRLAPEPDPDYELFRIVDSEIGKLRCKLTRLQEKNKQQTVKVGY